MIEVKDLTLTYPNGKGVFDLDFTIRQGEVTGYLGPNGAGKTTTIRALMGFMKPDQGVCRVNGLDCFHQAPEIQKKLGYLPGETSFPDNMNGNEFLSFIHQMRRHRDRTFEKQLIERFELELAGPVRRFSKGMKQKLAIVVALMHDPEILILDEPTSGLDPLMQKRFIELILEEKKKGKTILMSSHLFEEVERTCDRVLIIKEGRIIQNSDVQNLNSVRKKAFVVHTENEQPALDLFRKEGFEAEQSSGNVKVYVSGDQIDRFIKTAAKLKVLNLDMKMQTLEDIFIRLYSREER